MSTTKHTAEPWSDKEWSTTGPSAATAYVLSRELQRQGHFYCQIAQKDLDPGLSVCIAVGVTQEDANANASHIVACVNACTGIEDPAAAIKLAREALRPIFGEDHASMALRMGNALRALGG